MAEQQDLDREFAYWLMGALEIGNITTFTPEQMVMISHNLPPDTATNEKYGEMIKLASNVVGSYFHGSTQSSSHNGQEYIRYDLNRSILPEKEQASDEERLQAAFNILKPALEKYFQHEIDTQTYGKDTGSFQPIHAGNIPQAFYPRFRDGVKSFLGRLQNAKNAPQADNELLTKHIDTLIAFVDNFSESELIEYYRKNRTLYGAQEIMALPELGDKLRQFKKALENQPIRNEDASLFLEVMGNSPEGVRGKESVLEQVSTASSALAVHRISPDGHKAVEYALNRQDKSLIIEAMKALNVNTKIALLQDMIKSNPHLDHLINTLEKTQLALGSNAQQVKPFATEKAKLLENISSSLAEYKAGIPAELLASPWFASTARFANNYEKAIAEDEKDATTIDRTKISDPRYDRTHNSAFALC